MAVVEMAMLSRTRGGKKRLKSGDGSGDDIGDGGGRLR